MASIRQILLASSLAALGLLAWWIQTEDESRDDAHEVVERRPDYTVDQVTVTTMDETGRPGRRLVARELRHYPNDGGNDLEDPRLTVFKDDGPPWLVRSNRGHITEDGEELLLQGPVFMDRAAGEETRPVHIKTWELFIQTDKEYARTDRPVHLTSGMDWLSSASGAELWFGDELHLNLFGRARIQFDLP